MAEIRTSRARADTSTKTPSSMACARLYDEMTSMSSNGLECSFINSSIYGIRQQIDPLAQEPTPPPDTRTDGPKRNPQTSGDSLELEAVADRIREAL